jgi:hypothetical protein
MVLGTKKHRQDDRSIYDICQEETDDRYTPLHFISALQAFREQLDREHPEIVKNSRAFRE